MKKLMFKSLIQFIKNKNYSESFRIIKGILSFLLFSLLFFSFDYFREFSARFFTIR